MELQIVKSTSFRAGGCDCNDDYESIYHYFSKLYMFRVFSDEIKTISPPYQLIISVDTQNVSNCVINFFKWTDSGFQYIEATQLSEYIEKSKLTFDNIQQHTDQQCIKQLNSVDFTVECNKILNQYAQFAFDLFAPTFPTK